MALRQFPPLTPSPAGAVPWHFPAPRPFPAPWHLPDRRGRWPVAGARGAAAERKIRPTTGRRRG